MSKLRVHCFGVSIDGFGAGPNQDINNPLGVGGINLHQWFFPTRVFQKMQGSDDGTTGVDNDFAERGLDRIGAWILGRNMFGPVRGAWPDDQWKGWWGDDPPYHTQVFVLTHYPRASIEMEGGTTFHFVTDGIHSALKRAREAAGGLDVRLGGGPATIRRCHNKAHFLKFAKDRNAYRRKLRERLSQVDVQLYDYTITSNHVQLLLEAEDKTEVSILMQRVAGEFASSYNRRKKRTNAFWGDPFHATLVEDGCSDQYCSPVGTDEQVPNWKSITWFRDRRSTP